MATLSSSRTPSSPGTSGTPSGPSVPHRSGGAVRRVGVGLVAASALAALAVPVAGSASAATGRITGYGGTCVDVAASGTADGTAVQLYGCNGTGAQSWTVGTDGTIRALGKCLDAAGGQTSDGTLVQLWTCNGTGAQRWAVSGARDIVNVAADKCLDATGPSSADGTRLQLWTCSGQANQKWDAPAAGPIGPAQPAPAGRLIWSDEFDGPAGQGVDPGRWNTEVTGSGGGNQELQYYTAGTENAAEDGAGNLVITARRANAANYQCWYGTCQYTSGRLNTSGKFATTYGRIEARIQVPQGQGLWPAFWMLGADLGSVGWPSSGEIDILENVGYAPGTVWGTLHGPGYAGGESVSGSYTLPGGAALGDAFRTFAVDWAPGRITWSLDGTPFLTRTPADLGGDRWVFDKPFFLVLNLAVGGLWPGSPDASTPFPASLRVDYVRVYAP